MLHFPVSSDSHSCQLHGTSERDGECVSVCTDVYPTVRLALCVVLSYRRSQGLAFTASVAVGQPHVCTTQPCSSRIHSQKEKCWALSDHHTAMGGLLFCPLPCHTVTSGSSGLCSQSPSRTLTCDALSQRHKDTLL